MIIYDKQTQGWSHLLSTLFGQAGHDELMAFAEKIGLDPSWLQHKGRQDEHFDIKGSKYYAARDNGATQVSKQILGQTIIDKRAEAQMIDS